MALTTPSVADVRAMFTTSLDDAAVTAFIGDAELMAEGVPAIAGYTDSRQKAIIKYLAAHLMFVGGHATGSSAGVKTQVAVGDASESYASPNSGTFGMGLNASRYGQQALQLDTSGGLANLGKPRPLLTRI